MILAWILDGNFFCNKSWNVMMSLMALVNNLLQNKKLKQITRNQILTVEDLFHIFQKNTEYQLFFFFIIY